VNENARSLLTKARANLCYYEPYYGTALWAIHFVEVPDLIKTAKAPMACDYHWRVYYDPVVIESITDLKQLAAGILHELGHLVRDHRTRGTVLGVSPINFEAWNAAGDCELNDDLEADPNVDFKGFGAALAPFGRTAPGYCLPNQIGQETGKTAEIYYRALPEVELPVSGNCGSGAHGQLQEWETGKAEGQEEAPKIGKAEATRIKQYTAEQIRQHLKHRGTVPKGWKLWAEEYGKPAIDWRRQVATLIRNRLAHVYGRQDYSYTKYQRRQPFYGGIIVPAMTEPQPKVAGVLDTSGSMTPKDQAQCLGEIKGILLSVGVSSGIPIYCVDHAVYKNRAIRSVKDIDLRGGGGTDMRLGIQQAEQDAKGGLDVIIVLTDGETPWPAAPTRTPIIACLVGPNAAALVPKWIKTVVIPQ